MSARFDRVNSTSETPSVEDCHGGYVAPPAAEHPDNLRPPMSEVMADLDSDPEFHAWLEQRDAERNAEAMMRDAARERGVVDSPDGQREPLPAMNTATRIALHNASAVALVLGAMFRHSA